MPVVSAAWLVTSGALLVTSRNAGPGALHPPDGERVAQPLVCQVVASGRLAICAIVLQHLVEEVDVARRQLQDLDLAQLVRGQRGDNLAQRREGVVQRLRALALPYVGDLPLSEGLLRTTRPRREGGARGRGPL